MQRSDAPWSGLGAAGGIVSCALVPVFGGDDPFPRERDVHLAKGPFHFFPLHPPRTPRVSSASFAACRRDVEEGRAPGGSWHLEALGGAAQLEIGNRYSGVGATLPEVVNTPRIPCELLKKKKNPVDAESVLLMRSCVLLKVLPLRPGSLLSPAP